MRPLPSRRHRTRTHLLGALLTGMGLVPAPSLVAQSWNPLQRGSDNIEVVGHLPMGARLTVTDMDIEQGYPNISSAQDWDRGPVTRRLIGE